MNASIDIKNDVLAIHDGFKENESFQTNIVVGDVVLDISTTGRVCGVEILSLRRFLEDFEEDPEILKDLTSASFTVHKRADSILLTIVFETAQRSFPARLAVPLQPASA